LDRFALMNRACSRGRPAKHEAGHAEISNSKNALRKLLWMALLCGALGPRLTWSQTPSPLQE